MAGEASLPPASGAVAIYPQSGPASHPSSHPLLERGHLRLRLLRLLVVARALHRLRQLALELLS